MFARLPPRRDRRGTASRLWARQLTAAEGRTCDMSRRNRRRAASVPPRRPSRTLDTCTLQAVTENTMN